jgi:hypothetical protein
MTKNRFLRTHLGEYHYQTDASTQIANVAPTNTPDT